MLSARDRLEVVLSRLAVRADKSVFVKLYPEAARAAADAADTRRKAGVTLGPLDGAIISIKDLFDVAGEPTTAGSLLLSTAAPALQDAVIVRRLRQAGAVIFGKTNMTEFAFTAIGVNPHYGTPGNATDANRIAGGSSSGAGVSVAQGTSEISIGSDTGGSVRIPASLNGVVGFKPTARRRARSLWRWLRFRLPVCALGFRAACSSRIRKKGFRRRSSVVFARQNSRVHALPICPSMTFLPNCAR